MIPPPPISPICRTPLSPISQNLIRFFEGASGSLWASGGHRVLDQEERHHALRLPPDAAGAIAVFSRPDGGPEFRGTRAVLCDRGFLWSAHSTADDQNPHWVPWGPSVFSPVRVVRVALGGAHAMCVDSTGALWSWGSNRVGETGGQVTDEREVEHAPQQQLWLERWPADAVRTLTRLRHRDAIMHAEHPGEPASAPEVTGSENLPDGAFYKWGDDWRALDVAASRSPLQPFSLVLTTEGDVRVLGTLDPGTMDLDHASSGASQLGGWLYPKHKSLEEIERHSVVEHARFLEREGFAFQRYFGSWDEGERPVAVACGIRQFLALTSEGRVLLGGLSVHEDLAIAPRWLEVPTGERVVGVSAGAGYNALITSRGDLYTWGDIKPGGSLGYEVTDPGRQGGVYPPRRVPWLGVGSRFGRVLQVACGRSQTLVITDSGCAFGLGRSI